MVSRLASMTWDDVPPRPLVLVPIGSTEQHGPHLPFETDTLIATAAAERIADQLSSSGVDVVLAPAIAYGSSGEHQEFPGTISIGHDALRIQVVELVRSLSTWAGRIVFVNGHGGNITALSSAVAQMRQEQHHVAWHACIFESGGDAHAGSIETSIMLHLAPDKVRMDKAAAGQTAPLEQILPLIMSQGVRAASPTGVLGDPTGASADVGRQMMEQLVRISAVLLTDGTVDYRGRLVATEFASR